MSRNHPSPDFECRVERFKQGMFDSGFVDPEGVHHGFAKGGHGQKIDFGRIAEGSPLFFEWRDLLVDTIRAKYSARERFRMAIGSVANGTNQLVPYITRELSDDSPICLQTYKVNDKAVALTGIARTYMREHPSGLTVFIEDVGTTGSTSATAVLDARHTLGITPDMLEDPETPRIEVMNTWQRQDALGSLDAIGAPYSSVFTHTLEAYSPEDCQKIGFCAKGWKFIPHGQ